MDVLNGCASANREALLRSAGALPPFSPILNRLLASLAREDVQFSEVSGLIEKDTVLAGNLLRLVNSALYGMAGTVNSVRHALSIIGLEKARNFVLTFSLARLWQRQRAVPGWSPARFSLHSSAAAILADMLVQHLPAEYPEGAFTAGLFHDFGKLLMATSLPAEFAAVQARVEQRNDKLEACEQEIVGISHAELGAIALERWNLPAAISQAVRRHHDPEPCQGRVSPLSRIVHAANHSVNRLGISVLERHPENGQDPGEVFESLGMGGLSARLLDDFARELDLIRAFF
jgi:HD-like signal output (HDOD) protein